MLLFFKGINRFFLYFNIALIFFFHYFLGLMNMKVQNMKIQLHRQNGKEILVHYRPDVTLAEGNYRDKFFFIYPKSGVTRVFTFNAHFE